MGAVTDLITTHRTLGALSTGEHHFYEQLEWERRKRPGYVHDGSGLTRNADEDDGIMVVRVERSVGDRSHVVGLVSDSNR